MTTKYHQISFNDIFSDCQNKLITSIVSQPLQRTTGFLRFFKVPDASLMSRFKHDFESYIELMFQRMVDYTEPICQSIDSSLAQMLTFDTSGIELYVTENNPKTLNALIKNLRLFTKINLMSLLTRWLMDLCLHRLPPARMPSRCISTDTFVTLTNSQSSQMD